MNVNLSQLSFPSNNKILFAGVSDETKCAGEIRCYKFPHNGVYSSYQSHESSGIEKMKVSVDDQHLVTCGKDGVINVFEIKDKEIRNIKKDKDAYS
jgi:WD40 repeat protein